MDQQIEPKLGSKGEQLASDFLVNKGYKILERNYRVGHKEIDIIARDGNEIVIVEVKTRSASYVEEPWKAVSGLKIRHLVLAAETWLKAHQIELETRFDVISIVFSDFNNYEISHFEHAFNSSVE